MGTTLEELQDKFTGLNGRQKAKDAALNRADIEYHPPVQFYHELLVDELPIFNLWFARLMTRDPVVEIGLAARNAALSMVEWHVSSGNPRVAQYVDAILHDLWERWGQAIRNTKIAGYGGIEIDYRCDESSGLLRPVNVHEYAPRDVRCLKRKRGPIVGFNVKNANTEHANYKHRVLSPRGLWLTFRPEYSDRYGHTILRACYPSWYEKWMPGGYRKVRQLRMLKDAYHGTAIQVPFSKSITIDGVATTYAQLCREAEECRLAGGTLILPSIIDDNGNQEIVYTPAHDTGNPVGIYEWGNSLDDDILKGLDVFPEVIEAAETGSGFSGRSVPMMMFLQTVADEFQGYLRCIEDHVLRPLVWIEFGKKAQFSVTMRNIIETMAEQASGSPMGGSAMGGQSTQRKPPQQDKQDEGQQEGSDTQFAEGGFLGFFSHDTIDELVAGAVEATRKWKDKLLDVIRRQSRGWFGGKRDTRQFERWIFRPFEDAKQGLQEIIEDTLAAAIVTGQAGAVEEYVQSVGEALPTEPVPTMPAFPREIVVGGHVHERPPIVPKPSEQPPKTPVPPPKRPMDRKPVIKWEVSEKASDVLRRQPVATGEHYLQTAELVRNGAFAITADLQDKTVEQIRDLVADAIDLDLDRKQFIAAVNKLLGETGEIMGDHHIELVYRANVLAYQSEAAEHALRNPVIGSAMPYRALDSTHDDRVRDTHERLEQTGLDGTNIYRHDDPAYHAFRGPWAYGCRCRQRPVSVRQAALAGVQEAKDWMARAKQMARDKGGSEASHLAATAPLDVQYVDWPSMPDGEPILVSEAWARPGVPERYIERKETQFAERWITIGGHEEGDKKHAGGTPIKIDDNGNIKAGPQAIAEKGIKNLRDFKKQPDKQKDALEDLTERSRKFGNELSGLQKRISGFNERVEKFNQPEQDNKQGASTTAPGLTVDIVPYRDAYNAHAGTSFEPEKRAKQRQQEFTQSMQSIYDKFRSAADTPEKQQVLAEEWPKYLDRTKSDYLDMLHADSRIVSSMIAGPARFPVARMEKYNKWARNKLEAYLEQVNKGQNAVWKKLVPESQPTRIGDHGAGDVIQQQLKDREDYQEAMKKANAVIRKHWDKANSTKNNAVLKNGMDINTLVDIVANESGLSVKEVAAVLKPNYMGHIGFESFQLTNNNAQIARLRDRVKQQERYEKEAESAGGAKSHEFDGGSIELDYNENRLRIRHNEKPSREGIDKLKKNGFRWSPKEGAWQRQLTNAAKHAASQVTGVQFADHQKVPDQFAVTAEQVEDAASTTDTSPTESQRDAGNYRKGKIAIHGMTISIETPKGERRRPEWPLMAAHYGYVNRTEGVDGDHLDVFIGPNPESELVFVIDQVDESGEFDEHKVMIGYTNEQEAIDCYKACYTKDWKVGPVNAMTIKQFKAWIAENAIKTAKQDLLAGMSFAEWEESQHPREPSGTTEGGRFTTKASGTEATMRLYRAADDDHIGDSASFTEDIESARAYLDNPGFGGRKLFYADIEPADVLDLTDDDAMQTLMDAIDDDHDYGAIGVDELVPRIAEKIADSGYQWVKVRESYPADTITWIYVGGIDGDEPELVEHEE